MGSLASPASWSERFSFVLPSEPEAPRREAHFLLTKGNERNRVNHLPSE